MKRIVVLFFLSLFVLSFILPQSNLRSALAQNSGTFYGFDWEHGLTTRNFTKSFEYSRNFSESETSTINKTFTINAPIRTGVKITDILWQRWINRSKAAPTSTWQPPGSSQNWFGLRADGLLNNQSGVGGAWFRYEGITVRQWGSGIFGQSANYTSLFGRQIDVGLAERALIQEWKTSYVLLTPITNATVPMQDLWGVFQGSMNVSSYHIGYIYDNGIIGDFTDDELVFQELLVPQFVLVRVLTTPSQVNVTQITTVAASLSGAFNFSGTWQENLYGQHVSIKDGFNYWFDYFALISGNVNFDVDGGFSLHGSLSRNVTREVTYIDGGASIPESDRPAWLQSLRIKLDGDWDHSHSESGTLYGKGAIQSITQVLLTKASTDQLPNLAAWGNFNPGRMIGYKDLDGDGILTAFLNESQIATPDAIMAIGFPEGAHLEGDYEAKAIANANAYISLGDSVIDNQTSIRVMIDKTINKTWGYDPRKLGTGPSDVSLSWTDPVEVDGKAIFNWETKYSDQPVTWWATNGSAEIITHDSADITYGYSLTIDPEEGEAILESTYEQSTIQDTTLKDLMENQSLSMATYHRDYFLSMTQISADASGAFARPQSQFETSIAGKDLFSQDFGGKKEDYYLYDSPSTTYNAGTSVMNLLTAEGFSGEPTNQTQRNPFSSPISKRIAAAFTQWSADNRKPGVSWIFRENIVITSYPTWNGEGIIHDPAFSAYYAGTGARIGETSEVAETSGPTITSEDEGIPGFLFSSSLILLVIVTQLIKKRRTQ